jgi:hypothetical protein
MGSAQLEQLGLTGSQTAIMDEIVKLSSVAHGTGVSEQTISKIAVGRVARASTSSGGKMAAVLQGALNSGIIEGGDAQALMDTFYQTGELKWQDGFNALIAGGLSPHEAANMLTDRMITEAQSDPAVMARIVKAYNTHGPNSFRQMATDKIRKDMTSGRGLGGNAMEVLKARGISVEEFTDTYLEGFAFSDDPDRNFDALLNKMTGKDGNTLSEAEKKILRQYGAYRGTDLDSRHVFDDLENTRLVMRLGYAPDLDAAAATQVTFTEMLTDITRRLPMQKALEGIDSISKENARKIAADPKLRETLLDTGKVTLGDVDISLDDEQRKRLQEVADKVPAERVTTLEKIGEALANGENIAGIVATLSGVDRQEVVREIQATYLTTDGEGEKILNEEALIRDKLAFRDDLGEFHMVGDDVSADLMLDHLNQLSAEATDAEQKAEEKRLREADALNEMNEQSKKAWVDEGLEPADWVAHETLDAAELAEINKRRKSDGLSTYDTMQDVRKAEQRTEDKQETVDLQTNAIEKILQNTKVRVAIVESVTLPVESPPLDT